MFFIPGKVPITSTLNWHAAKYAPLAKVIEFDPGTAVTVPPHEAFNPFGVATTSPAGNVSVKLTPVRLTPTPEKISKVSGMTPFT